MDNRRFSEKLNFNQENWISKYKMERFEKFKVLPMPSWKRLRLKDFTLPELVEYRKEYINKVSNEGNVVLASIEEGLQGREEFREYLNLKDEYGVSGKLIVLGEAFNNTGIFVNVPRNERLEGTIKVEYELSNDNPVVIDHNLIIAEENSEVTVIIDYATKGNEKAFHNGVTKVYVEEGAVVNIVKIQRMNDSSNNFDSNVAFVKRGGKINWISVEIGSDISTSSFITYLEDVEGEGDLRSVYLGDGTRRMDLQYSMIHRGARTLSNIETRGVLKDESKKIFRGNLDFKRGSRRSKGVEEEFVILLDPRVKSDAIPALLCEEDDVIGEHAASAGQIDEDKLFYLMSRGLTKIQAKKLIVEASFRPILDRIPLKGYQEIIQNEIHRRMVNE